MESVINKDLYEAVQKVINLHITADEVEKDISGDLINILPAGWQTLFIYYLRAIQRHKETAIVIEAQYTRGVLQVKTNFHNYVMAINWLTAGFSQATSQRCLFHEEKASRRKYHEGSPPLCKHCDIIYSNTVEFIKQEKEIENVGTNV